MSTHHSPPQNKNQELYSMWCSKFDLARYRLLSIKRQEGREEVKRRGIVIDREISLETYLGFCDKEPRISVKYRLADGTIEAYEMPVDLHAVVQAKLIGIVDNWNDQLQVFGELDIIVGSRMVYRPDISIRPRNRQRPQASQAVNSSGHPYPTLVVEIGNTESVRSLHDLVIGYFSPRNTIQIYFAIKLFPPRRDNSVALLALLYLRNNPNPTITVIAKSFGTAPLHISTQNYLQNTANVPVNTITGVGYGGVPCDGANLQDYQIAIPTILLFNGVPGGVPNGVPANFNIDLWRLQDAILNLD
ncbi:11080_t:CDS:1 [Acaulospora morrowiae]|uniref:11080_t:CDS:1 n=1 Tax=Acaulospora morrowiae TaxID=94023 RepID=A0A9N9E9C3_9GLOM|nr:11080_t:CDS:1 [Acaulospora morrowiae]